MRSSSFIIQFDEVTDTNKDCHLIVYVRLCDGQSAIKAMFWKKLEIFNKLDDFLDEVDLQRLVQELFEPIIRFIEKFYLLSLEIIFVKNFIGRSFITDENLIAKSDRVRNSLHETHVVHSVAISNITASCQELCSARLSMSFCEPMNNILTFAIIILCLILPFVVIPPKVFSINFFHIFAPSVHCFQL